jgi:Flp pilus assembly pilin Flp
MRRLASGLGRFVRSDAGANALEYTLVMSLIAFAIVTGAGALGTGLNSFFSNTATGVSSVALPPL